jgi:hypothetical protein
MSGGQSGRTLSGNTGASTRSPLNVEISAKIPVRDFLVSAHSRFSHRHLLRIRGCFVVRGGGAAFFAEQVPPPCSRVRYSRFSHWLRFTCQWSERRFPFRYKGASARSPNEHWLVYSVSHRQPSAFCLRLERRPLPTPNARAASARS